MQKVSLSLQELVPKGLESLEKINCGREGFLHVQYVMEDYLSLEIKEL
jgi:hypothetical protein